MPTHISLVTPRAVSTVHWLLRWCLWPAALCVATVAAWRLHQQPERAMALQMATFLAAVLLAMLAERVVPLRRDWQQVPRAERRTDLTSMAVLMLLADPVVKRGLLPLVAAAGVPWFALQGAQAAFPVQWPLALQLLLAAVIAEGGQYAVHRAMHSVRWLWGLHGFHHNPTRIYWLNGFRAHPLNMIVHQLAGLGVLVAIGAPAPVIQMLILFSTVAAVFQHANADLRYDGWNWVFSTADLHRWHHAAGAQSCQANFGGLLTVWDHLFGTFRRGDVMPALVGVDAGAPRATGYVGALREAMRNALARPAARAD